MRREGNSHSACTPKALSRTRQVCHSVGSGLEKTVQVSSANTVLGGKPLEKILTVSGLVDVIAYLDARRALV